MQAKQFFPILDWLPSYKKSDFSGDLTAGLTVGVMLIPQGMAYAMIAGLPPIYGLYAALIPLVVYALLGTSRQLAVGPVAMVSLLTAAGVGALAEIGTERYIELAILLALLAGIMQVLMGLFRLGFLVNFLSQPVLAGFTSAAALIIGLSQLKHLLGLDLARSSYVHEVLISLEQNIAGVHIYTLLLGLGGIAILLIVKRFTPQIPGPLVLVVVSTLVVWGADMEQLGVSIVGIVPSGLPAFTLPTWDLGDLKDLAPMALTICLVSFVESIAIAKTLQAKHRNYEVDSNQELFALGFAKIAGAFFLAFPNTGGFSRSAVNDQAGARTGLAGLITALLLAISLLFLTPLFYFLPKAVLASIIMVSVFKLIDFKGAKQLWKAKREDFFMMLATFLATLVLGIQIGILIGVALSLALMIYHSAYPHIAVLGRIPGTYHFRNIKRFPEAIQQEEVLVMRFDAQLYFANAGYFREKVKELAANKGESLELIVFNFESVHNIDTTALSVLKQLVEDFRKQGVEISFAAVIGPVRDSLYKAEMMEFFGKDNFFLHVDHALKAFMGEEISLPPHKGERRAVQTDIY